MWRIESKEFAANFGSESFLPLPSLLLPPSDGRTEKDGTRDLINSEIISVALSASHSLR